MTYRGHIKNGQILLDEPAELPEGTEVSVEVVHQGVRITSPKNPVPLRRIKPIEMPGGSLADELVRDRR
jgi:hypothetical protein